MRKMTKANLEAAFAGESQAHMKYAIFADKAEREGFPEVARLFRAISYAERVHATAHLRELGSINDTVANLEAAAGGEHYEITEMYPAFDAVAKLQEFVKMLGEEIITEKPLGVAGGTISISLAALNSNSSNIIFIASISMIPFFSMIIISAVFASVKYEIFKSIS